MKHYLLIIAAVALVGCGKKTTTDEVDGQPVNPNVVGNKSPKVKPKKLIADPIVEKEIRRQLKKPEGELTKADLEQVTEIDL